MGRRRSRSKFSKGGARKGGGVRGMYHRKRKERGSFARAVGSSQNRIGGLLSLTR